MKKFTLIELLVVITIISILAALTSTGLMKSRTRAIQTSSKANLKAISLNIVSYLTDQAGSNNDPILPSMVNSDAGALGDSIAANCPFYERPYQYGTFFSVGGPFLASSALATSDLINIQGATTSTIKYRPSLPYALRADSSVGTTNE